MRVEKRLAGFGEEPHNRGRGARGEEVAAELLEELGYEILERNVHARGGELDVVAMHGDCLCFVEIKVRSSAEYGTSLEAVDARKRRRIVRSARIYMALHGLIEPLCRFDVLGVDRTEEGWAVTLVQDAFTADGLF